MVDVWGKGGNSILVLFHACLAKKKEMQLAFPLHLLKQIPFSLLKGFLERGRDRQRERERERQAHRDAKM